MVADANQPATPRLRLLATSDLHMQLIAFDYARDRPSKGGSLAKLATLVADARAEAKRDGAACLLLDNGDTLQGTPLADMAVRRGTDLHPMVACMNHLRYDAGGLGNHDFDHGLEHLASCLAAMNMPVVCSNMAAAALPTVARSLLIDCKVGGVGLRIGVVSSVPEKTALWNRYQLQNRVTLEPPLPALRREAEALRARGADLVVALAHMGIALFDEGTDAQNLVTEVAALDAVDVVIGGHTHLRFPGPDHAGVAHADCVEGRVHGKPVVQPGASAADLGVIDLALEGSPERGWRIAEHTVSLRPARPDTPEDPDILRMTADNHAETRHFLSQTVTRLSQPVNSFFALAHPSPVPALLAAAKRRAIAQVVAGTDHASLPLVAVASAPLTGGFDGPDNFMHMAGGQMHRHHVAGMNPYANNVWAVRTTGAQLADWLERSALIFNTLIADAPDQLLVDPRVPGFRYDAIYGLTYQIDPRKPPRFDPSGQRMADRQGRVSDIRFEGRPLRDDQQFLVATTDHRAGGGGVYQTFSTKDIVVQGHAPMQEALLDYLRDQDGSELSRNGPWRFAPDMNLAAVLLTAPEAVHHLAEISHLKPEPCGETEYGFLRLRLHL